MNLISELDIPNVYRCFGRIIDRKYTKSKMYEIYQYYCSDCDSYFTVNRVGKHALYGMITFGDEKVTCPCCGKTYTDNTKIQNLFYFATPNDIIQSLAKGVISCNMRLYEAENTIKLKVTYNTMIFSEKGAELQKVTEELLFDVKNWSTRFRLNENGIEKENCMLGNPLNRDFLERSFIVSINTYNEASKQGKELCSMLKLIREKIQKKFKKVNGFELKSPYVSYGTTFGRLAYPLFNLAYRIAFPDAKNLPVKFADKTNFNYLFYALYGISNEDKIIWQEVVEQSKEKDRIKMLRQTYNLPNTSQVRRLMHEDIFDCVNYHRTEKICSNPDIRMSIFKQVKKMKGIGASMYFAKSRNTLRLYDSLESFAEYFSSSQILTLLSLKEGWSYIIDILDMFNQLPLDVKQKALKIKVKKLHKWLTDEVYKLKNKNYLLNVPTYIKKRLEMQKDRVKFFMPDTLYNLRDAGKELHNCVGSYGSRCINGESSIVLMSDDMGKLIACIELHDDKLVQAKLRNNVPVKVNNEVNKSILDWCKDVGVTVQTPDINLFAREEVKYVEA